MAAAVAAATPLPLRLLLLADAVRQALRHAATAVGPPAAEASIRIDALPAEDITLRVRPTGLQFTAE